MSTIQSSVHRVSVTSAILCAVLGCIPWSAVRVGNEDADVDAENGEDDTEQRDGRELADELDTNEDTNEH